MPLSSETIERSYIPLQDLYAMQKITLLDAGTRQRVHSVSPIHPSFGTSSRNTKQPSHLLPVHTSDRTHRNADALVNTYDPRKPV